MSWRKKRHFEEVSFLEFLARPERFERPTPWFVAKYSIQLSYGRAEEDADYTYFLGKAKRFLEIIVLLDKVVFPAVPRGKLGYRFRDSSILIPSRLLACRHAMNVPMNTPCFLAVSYSARKST